MEIPPHFEALLEGIAVDLSRIYPPFISMITVTYVSGSTREFNQIKEFLHLIAQEDEEAIDCVDIDFNYDLLEDALERTVKKIDRGVIL